MATEVKNGGVTVGAAKSREHGSFRRFLKFKYVMTALLLLLMVLGAVFCVVHTNEKNAEKLDPAKVKPLVASGNCSASAQKSVSKEQPNPKQVQASISLLNYKALCLEGDGKYREANTVLVQLKGYYNKLPDPEAIQTVNDQIQANNKAIPHSNHTSNTGTTK